MTALAVVASCYNRFEAIGIEERLDTLYSFLAAFVVYAGVVYFLFHLYEAKWRFASLPDLTNIVRASSVPAVSLLIVDYFLVAPNVLGQYFFGKIPIAVIGSRRSCCSAVRACVPLFPLFPHAAACALATVQSGADPRPRRRRRGAVARHRKRPHHQHLAPGWLPIFTGQQAVRSNFLCHRKACCAKSIGRSTDFSLN